MCAIKHFTPTTCLKRFSAIPKVITTMNGKSSQQIWLTDMLMGLWFIWEIVFLWSVGLQNGNSEKLRHGYLLTFTANFFRYKKRSNWSSQFTMYNMIMYHGQVLDLAYGFAVYFTLTFRSYFTVQSWDTRFQMQLLKYTTVELRQTVCSYK